MKKKSFVYPIVFMALITAIYTFVLAYMDHATADKISFLQETDLRTKILYIFDVDTPDLSPEAIDEIFTAQVGEETFEGKTVYVHKPEGEVLAYAFPVHGAGLWGSVDGYLGISADYDKIVGLEFTEHSETPGLGGRISEEDFKGQFRDLDITEADDGQYIIYRPAAGGNVDAIAGATLTSKSVSQFLNVDLEEFIKGRKVD